MFKLAVVLAILAVATARYYDYDYDIPRRVMGLGGRGFRNLLVNTRNSMYNSRYYDNYYNDGYGYDPYDSYRGHSGSRYGRYDTHYDRDYYPTRRVSRRRRY